MQNTSNYAMMYTNSFGGVVQKWIVPNVEAITSACKLSRPRRKRPKKETVACGRLVAWHSSSALVVCGCLSVAIKAPARQRSKIRPSACVRTAETAGTSDAIPYLFICPAAPLEWRGLLSASCGRVEAVSLEPYRRTAAGLPHRCHILYTIRIAILLAVCNAQFFFISHKTAADFVYNENFNFHFFFLRIFISCD